MSYVRVFGELQSQKHPHFNRRKHGREWAKRRNKLCTQETVA